MLTSRLIALAFAGLFSINVVLASSDSTRTALWIKPRVGALLKPSAMVQTWATYTFGQELYDPQQQQYIPVDDRLNIYLRRARLLFRGEPYEGLQYYLSMHYDQAGHDLLSATQGPNNINEPAVGIWDAFIQYRLPFAGDALHLTTGWFRPQFQREAITTGWGVSSLEKSMSQNYVRTHLTGRGPGRAAGLNLGGMLKGHAIALLYNAGLFNPLLTGLGGNSVGIHYAPLLSGRLSLQLGDPEMESYGISYTTNYFGKRKGLSLDLNIARQGQTDQFEVSNAWGTGFLFNHGPWVLDGEWVWMKRRGEGVSKALSETGHFRMGYNIPVGKFILQPAGLIMFFEGGMDGPAQAQARTLKMGAGKEQTIDLGINWFLNKRDLVIQLHYTLHQGDAGAAGPGSTVNAFFNQTTVGAIRRGDWLGLGFNAIF
jgi:hypothetical protein